MGMVEVRSGVVVWNTDCDDVIIGGWAAVVAIPRARKGLKSEVLKLWSARSWWTDMVRGEGCAVRGELCVVRGEGCVVEG